MGRASTFEHAGFVRDRGVSRALLAQITRHRIASFSVQSQRYVNQNREAYRYVIPLDTGAGEKASKGVADAADDQVVRRMGQALGAKGNPQTGARFVYLTPANAHDRDDERARTAAFLRAQVLQPRAVGDPRWLGTCWNCLDSRTFRFGGAACVRGACRRKMSCGRMDEVREPRKDQRGKRNDAGESGVLMGHNLFWKP